MIPLEHEISGLTILASFILNPIISPEPKRPDLSGLIETGSNANVSICGNSPTYTYTYIVETSISTSTIKRRNI